MYIVLVYDVSQEDNGARRWARIFKLCKKYLTHIQNSVFEGELSKGQLAQLQKELKEYIDKELDSVIIFKSRQEKWLDKEFWGRKYHITSIINRMSYSDRLRNTRCRQSLNIQDNYKNDSYLER